MTATRFRSQPVVARRGLDTLIPFALFVWWLLAMKVLPFPGSQSFLAPDRLNDVTSSIRGGSLREQTVSIIFGLLGLLCARSALENWRRHRPAALRWLLVYGLWAGLSLLWTTDTSLSFRRFGEFGLLVMGSVGLGLGFYRYRPDGRRRLVGHLIVAGAVAMGVVWIPAVVRSELAIFDPSWALRSVGEGHTVGFPVAIAMLAALHSRFSSLRFRLLAGRRAHTLFVLFGFFTLLALRKRGLFAVVVVLAILVVFLLLGGRGRKRSGAQLVLAGALAVLLVALTGSDPTAAFIEIAARGQDPTEVASLSGRLPLWEELVGTYLNQEPVRGWGFGAFWSPARLFGVWDAVGWPAVSAHNGYLDEMLATGIPGALAMTAIWASGLWQSLRAGRRERDGLALLAAAVAALYLAMNLITSLNQNYESYPFLVGLTLFGVVDYRRRP